MSKTFVPLALAAALAGSAALALPAAAAVRTTTAVHATSQGPGAFHPDFYPSSVTFVSLRTGWALGSAPCAAGGTCLAMRKTTDGGRSWSAVPLPASMVAAADRVKVSASYLPGSGLNVRFANPEDGWVFGTVPVKGAQGVTQQMALWGTTDGGATWSTEKVPGTVRATSYVLDLEASGAQAYLLVWDLDKVYLYHSPVGVSGWSYVPGLNLGLPAGGSNLTGSIVLQGATGWLVEGNDRGTTGAARLVDGQWQDWTPPCADVGGTLAFPAAANASDLYTVCVMGGFASPLPKYAPPGATVGSSWLYTSTDGGTTFEPVAELATQQATADLGGVLASPSPRTVIIDRGPYQHQYLAVSVDGGYRYANVYRGTFIYLGFTSPSQGVAIVQGPGAGSANTSMIMTYDGGHDWHKVVF